MSTPKIWKFLKQDRVQADRISQEFKFNPIVAQVMLNRGLTDITDISEFLNSDIYSLSDPFLMKDMDKAVKRVATALKNFERIVVCGDYDVDGITSTTIVVDFLRKCGAEVSYYIPDRIDDGYGLNMSVAEKLIGMNSSLVITVDNGITSVSEVDFLRAAGIDVIVTDHHECKGKLPNAIAVINPHRQDDAYPFKFLAGVGVAYRFIEAIYLTVKDMGIIQYDVDIERYIELVAIGTIADVMPLVGENRTVVKYGLQKVNKTQNIGLKELISVAGLSDKSITTWSVGFVIAPRMNAAGRMSNAEKVVELLLTNSSAQANEVAKMLDEENITRQKIERDILQEVFEKIEQEESFSVDEILVVQGENWHHGVIGIVASKVTDRYNRPCILLSTDGEMVKGSARSIPGFNIYDALCSCSEHLERFGGHELAGGLTLRSENVLDFSQNIKLYASEHIEQKQMMPTITIDAELSAEELTIKCIEDLELLAPFGTDNNKPLFCCMCMNIVEIKTTSDQRHLKLKLSSANKTIEAIGFNMGDAVTRFNTGDIVDVAFYLEINSWNFMPEVQLNIRDLKISEDVIALNRYYSSFDYDSFYQYATQDDCATFNDLATNLNELYSSDCLEQFKDLLATNVCKIVFVNTFEGIRDVLQACRQLGLDEQNGSIFHYNSFKSVERFNVCIVVNPKIDEIDVEDFNDVIFYRFACSRGFLMNFAKSLNPEHTLHYIGKDSFSKCISEVISDVIPNREELEVLYRFLSRNRRLSIGNGGTLSLSNKILARFNKKMSCAKLENGLGIFEELGLVTIERCEELDGMQIKLNDSGKVDIQTSNLYKNLQSIKNAVSM